MGAVKHSFSHSEIAHLGEGKASLNIFGNKNKLIHICISKSNSYSATPWHLFPE